MPVQVSPPAKVGALIKWYCDHGCEVGEVPLPIPTPYGAMKVRYLRNKANGRFVELVDLEDDESVFQSEYSYWSRRLGLPLPFV